MRGALYAPRNEETRGARAPRPPLSALASTSGTTADPDKSLAVLYQKESKRLYHKGHKGHKEYQDRFRGDWLFGPRENEVVKYLKRSGWGLVCETPAIQSRDFDSIGEIILARLRRA